MCPEKETDFSLHLGVLSVSRDILETFVYAKYQQRLILKLTTSQVHSFPNQPFIQIAFIKVSFFTLLKYIPAPGKENEAYIRKPKTRRNSIV